MEPDAGRRAAALFAATSVVAAITVGAMMVGGWGAGRLDNDIEWVFWAGAILGAVGIGLLGVASVRASGGWGLVRAGMALFLVGPVLCVVAVFTDYWI
jgi:hypothetical protein